MSLFFINIYNTIRWNGTKMGNGLVKLSVGGMIKKLFIQYIMNIRKNSTTMLKYIGCKLKGILDSIVRWYKSLKEWGYLLWLIIIVVSFIIVSNIPFFEIKQNMYYYESSKVYNIETKVTYNTSWYKVYRIYEHVVNLSEKDSDKIFSTYKSEYLKAEEFKKNYKKYIKNER